MLATIQFTLPYHSSCHPILHTSHTFYIPFILSSLILNFNPSKVFQPVLRHPNPSEFIQIHSNSMEKYQNLFESKKIFKVLAYQRRCRVRITYNWRELWSAMIGKRIKKHFRNKYASFHKLSLS